MYSAVGAFGAVADLAYIETLTGASHDGHALSSANSVVIAAGQKAIIYYSCDASLDAEDVEQAGNPQHRHHRLRGSYRTGNG